MSNITPPRATRPDWFAPDAYREQRGEQLPANTEEIMSEEHTNLILPSEEVEESENPVAEEGGATEDLEAVRALIMALHPGIVPELIGGDSVTALIASIAPAQEAYDRIVATGRVPAGGNPVVGVDTEALSAIEKIQSGLKGRPFR